MERTAVTLRKKSTVHERFKSWKDKGILEAVFTELSKGCDMQDLSIDSTSCKAHQHAAGAKAYLAAIMVWLK